MLVASFFFVFHTAFSLLDEAKNKFGEINGENDERIRAKFNAVIQRNPDIEVLNEVTKILNGNNKEDILKGSGAKWYCKIRVLPHYKCSRICRKVFSIYKNILSDHHHV